MTRSPTNVRPSAITHHRMPSQVRRSAWRLRPRARAVLSNLARGRLLATAVIGATLVGGIFVGPAAAADPKGQTALAGGWGSLAPEQQSMVATKLRLAAQGQGSFGAAQVVCPFVAEGPPGDGASASPQTGCGSYWGYLSTYARQQSKSYYCGPAAVQVVSNYSWGYGSTGNKYPQSTIATWSKTDINGQTLIGDAAFAVNTASILPPGFTYYAAQPSDGAQWHTWLREDINRWAMPMIASLAPHDPGAAYYLTSWPNPILAGHYVVVNGWSGVWSGDASRSPTVNYNDGSNGYGGSTGAFIDPAHDVWYVIARGNSKHSARWVVW